HHVEGADQVDVDHHAEAVRGLRIDRGDEIAGRAGDQHVNGAKLAGRAVERTPDRVEVADVGGDAGNVAASCPQRGDGGVDVVLLTTGDGDVRAVLREVLGDSEADTGRASEDERVLSGEVQRQRHGDRSILRDWVTGSSGRRRRAP